MSVVLPKKKQKNKKTGGCQWNFIVYVYPPIRGDWLLGFLYRSSAAQLSVAGLQPVNIQDRRIINVDLSSVVSQT